MNGRAFEMEKRPRHYAAEIVRLRTLDQRRAALELVPEHLRELTAAHIRNEWQRRKSIGDKHIGELRAVWRE